ncbi:hypothetical protein [Aquihabitans sp. McL0605]|uniref:hypothetical protein n=1 Tax=Aquihabitans sp. McL0605 TaxID=3415671 RepID=UPI003CF111FC
MDQRAADGDPGSGAAPGRWVRLRRRAAIDAVPLITFAIFVVAGLAWATQTWHPVEDLAITELMVRQIGHHTPLSGAYSSLPFHHPGPLLFWYLWGPYELFGERSSALLTATIWFNGAVLALILAVARRLGGRVLALVVAGAVLLWALDDHIPRLLQPWNPYVGALPMVALVLLTWAMVERRSWALPLSVGLASWAVQAHVQYAPVVLPLLVAGTVGLVVQAARHGGRVGVRSLLRPVAIAVAVGVALWLPAAVDLVLHGSSSNVAAMARYYTGDAQQARQMDPRDFGLVLRSTFSLHPMWAGGPRAYHLLLLPTARETPWGVLVLVLAIAGAAWRRAADELRGIAVALLAVALAFLALTQITGKNLTQWYLIPVGATGLALDAIVVASVIATVRRLLAGAIVRIPAPVRAAAPRVAMAATLALVVAIPFSFQRQRAEEVPAAVAQQMLPTIEQTISDGQPIFLEARYGVGGWVQAALALQLQKAGYPVYAKGSIPGKFPPSMDTTPPDDAVRLIFLTNPSSTDWLPGIHTVAEASFGLKPGDVPIHVVVVEAPLDATALTTAGT